jgi:hypothetical protein
MSKGTKISALYSFRIQAENEDLDEIEANKQ